MKIKKSFIIIFAILFWVILFSNKSFAGTQRWNSLDYNVKLNYDGSMDVIETWDIYISETNTLFKDWSIDPSKYSGITDVSVSQISPEKKSLKQIFEEQYHVDPGCFYALDINSSTFEIAWNVGLDNSSATRTYQISYTVKDAVKIYKDCTELYWMFLNTDNTISANKVTGTIKLPARVSDIEKLRVWGHGPLNANIERTSTDTVKFDCEKFPSETMLEIRVVTEDNVYEDCTNKYNKNKLDYILEEEQAWADEANAKRRNAKILMGIIYALSAVIVVYMGKKILGYINEGKELDLKYKRIMPDLKYFRDIPNEKSATPARAAYLYNFKGKTAFISNMIPQIFSATMLDLALKKYIDFEPIDKKNFNIIINNKESAELSDDEAAFYKVLTSAARGADRVSTKELLKYSKTHYESLHSTFESISTKAKNFHKQDKNFDDEREKVYDKWSGKGGTYAGALAFLIFGAFFAFPFAMAINENIGVALVFTLPIITIGIIIAMIVCFKNAGKVSILSDKGAEEQLEWKGLKNYMKDFSMLKDKEVPDLILWEKFLVYATAFGISKEVIKQLKVVYPEMSDPNFYNNHNYAYMYYMCDSRFGDNFINTFDSAMSNAIHASQNAYSAAHSSSSSGSGGGGGFSGGGGGRRRPEVALEGVRTSNLNKLLKGQQCWSF